MSHRRKKIDILINWIFFSLSIIFLYVLGRKFIIYNVWKMINAKMIIIVLIAVLCVNLIKMLRLYIILFGNKFKFSNYLHVYIKTAMVNCLLPFRLGEVYRGYCIGNMIHSIGNGYIMVLFDRFVDTLALMTVVIITGLFTDLDITVIYIFLILFLLSVILVYWLFMPLYLYWNQFLIYNKSSDHTLQGLKFLKICREIFLNIKLLVNGRFAIVYFISLFAWGIEVGMIQLIDKNVENMRIGGYLSDILTGHFNVSNMFYTTLCIFFFIIFELAIYIINKWMKMHKKIWGDINEYIM